MPTSPCRPPLAATPMPAFLRPIATASADDREVILYRRAEDGRHVFRLGRRVGSQWLCSRDSTVFTPSRWAPLSSDA